MAVILSTAYCCVQNHDEVRLIPGSRILDMGMSREMSRWTRSADCIVASGKTRSVYGANELPGQFELIEGGRRITFGYSLREHLLYI
jgi:hypothetical protein